MAAVVINVAGTFDGKAFNQAQKALGKLGGSASKHSKGFSGSIGKMSGALKGLVAGFGVGMVVNGLERLASAAQESAKVSAITAQALKTTGASAWTSADAINNLSTAISNKTGMDDEAVQHAANLLLTFKEVKNAGEGQAAMFDRATNAAADLAATGFGDLDSSAKMLGKALNDPTKGLTALSRAGVQFTDQQKAQITALQKSGDMLGAQSIIMKEVESQVGGAAAAAADPIGMLKTQLGNLAEEAGKGLLPAIKGIATSLGPLFQQLQPVLAQLGGSLGNLITQIVTALTPALGPLIQVVGILVEALGGALGQVLPPLAAALAQVAVALAPIIAKAAKFVSVLIDALMPAIQPVLDALMPLIDALLTGLTPILDVAISLVQSLAPYLAILGQTLGQVVTALAPLIPALIELVNVALVPVMGILNAVLPLVAQLATAFAGFASGFISDVVGVISGALHSLAGGLSEFFENVLGKIPVIGDKFKQAGDAIQGFADSLIAGVSAPSSTATKSAAATGTSLGKTMSRSLGKELTGGGEKTIAKSVGDALKAGLDAGKEALKKFQDQAKEFFDLRKQIADSIASSADIKNALPTGGMVGPSAEGIIANLQGKLAQVRKFGDLLSQVSGMVAGTPGGKALIDQLIGAGPVDGAALASALLAGGKKALSQIVGVKGGKGEQAGLFAQMNAAATNIGTIGASSATGLTLAQAQGYAKTDVKVEKGAIVVNFGAGVTSKDRHEISHAVDVAVTKALKAARDEAQRGK